MLLIGEFACFSFPFSRNVGRARGEFDGVGGVRVRWGVCGGGMGVFGVGWLDEEVSGFVGRLLVSGFW